MRLLCVLSVLAPLAACGSSSSPATRDDGAQRVQAPAPAAAAARQEPAPAPAGDEAPQPPPPAPERAARAPLRLDAAQLRESDPVACTGNRTLRLSGVLIETDDVAVSARGACNLIIEDSIIRAGRVAVEVGDSGKVVVRRSRVVGETAAVHMGAASTVVLEGSELSGGVRRNDSARLVDAGGNSFRNGTPRAAERSRKSGPEIADLEAAQAQTCEGNQRLRLTGLRIDSPEDGLTVRDNCTVILSDSEIRAGGAGIRVIGSGSVVVVRSRVVGEEAAVYLRGASVLRAQWSTFDGGLDRRGAAEYADEGGNRWQ